MLAILAFSAMGLNGQQRMAITMDDLPSHGALPPGATRQTVADAMLAAFTAAKVPQVYGFVNGNRLQENTTTVHVLEAWRKAGYPLGNHAWSHMNLNEHELKDWEVDVLKSEPILEEEMPHADWHWLRFPYLAEGNTPEKIASARAFLNAHGYRIASVTLSFNDSSMNSPYAACVAKGDKVTATQMEQHYLALAEDRLRMEQEMSQTLYGRQVPLVLLAHIGVLDAKMMPQLLRMFQSHGVQFVTIEEAESDPFYKRDVDLSQPGGAISLEHEMALRRLPLPKPKVELLPYASLCK